MLALGIAGVACGCRTSGAHGAAEHQVKKTNEIITPPVSAFYADKQHLLVWRDRHGSERTITTVGGWSKRREHILANFELVAGPLPDCGRLPPLEVAVLEEIRLPELTRRRLTFQAEKGDRVPAWLFLPRTADGGKMPAVLCLHQTTAIGKGEPAGLGGSANLHYAAELARRGYVTLAPDYPNFGDYRVDVYALGYASATMKGILNHRRAVDVLQSLRQVDDLRIGVIGHSLGGHNALFAAAWDPRLKVVVSSCGFNSFFKYAGGDLTGWSHRGYMPRIASVYGRDPRQMPFDFTELLAALAPRPVFVNAPLHDSNFEVSGVKDCLSAAAPVYRLHQAEDRLVATHPNCGHDFPPAVREAAYGFLDRWLGRTQVTQRSSRGGNQQPATPLIN